MRKYIFIAIAFTIFAVEAKSQKTKGSIDSLKIAEAFIENENFVQAIEFYKKFLRNDAENPELNFKLGFCILNTGNGKEKAIPYLEKAVKAYNKKEGNSGVSYIESKFYLARTYRAIYKFDTAIVLFEELKTIVKSKSVLKEIEDELNLCNTGKELYKNKVGVTITNMGPTINSEFSDHSPVFSADESLLIFTSRRKHDPIPGTDPEESDDGQYDEDIYKSEKIEGVWTTPVSIGPNINTAEHEASIGLSIDGQILFFYTNDDEGSIYESRLEGTEWGIPTKLGPNINTKYRETHASLSADGNSLYFTSDRKGGFGGTDIYVSDLMPDGSWGSAKNLGNTINTTENEEGPFIHPDGITLYFSTKGRGGLGSYDIFKAQKNEFGTWSMPENIGYPINTVGDDVFYVPTPDGRHAYYASAKEGGLGGNDLYFIDLLNAQSTDVTVMIGKVFVCEGKIPKSRISITNIKTEIQTFATPNIATGKFVFVVNKGEEYLIKVEVAGKSIFTDKIKIDEKTGSQMIYKTIRLDPGTNCIPNISLFEEGEIDVENIDEEGNVYDSNIKVKNILFAFNQNEFSPDKDTNIDDLINYLKENPTAIIEMGAYADSKGKAISNQILSTKRADAVKKYLVKKGINAEQLKVVGYGEENPISLNIIGGKFNEESQKFNRRLEFKILNQGYKTLLIKPINEIPKEFKNPNYDKKYVKSEKNTIETEI